MAHLLIELFSEEIPARMQLQAARDFERLFGDKLKAQGLSWETLKAYVGPRRLALHVEGLPLEQAAVSEEVKGPKEGAPEQAMAGFLRKVGLTQDQLVLENGVWLARIEKPAKQTAEVLPGILEEVILVFPWPKSMRSGTSSFRWVRPLKRIIFLFDGAVIPFEIGGVASGNLTQGHRFLSSGEPFAVSDFKSYKQGLKDAFVVLDHAERQSIIIEKAYKVTAEAGCALMEDHGLLEEVAGLNEWPTPLLGDMDPKFLTLPPEVIKTSMRTHQKYFAVRDLSTQKMAAKFLIVSNMKAADKGAEIKRGNAKVLSARLSDGVFFWSEDNRKGNFDQWLAKLNGVTFHAKLGTMAQRVARIEALAGQLAPLLRADAGMASEAARLAKADLASYMVGEFPELQGIMGGYYAEAAKLAGDVSEAIREHYKPQGPSDSVPEGAVSAAVALADKIDTLVGFFAIDEKPTGSKDPFALRRAALGVLRILRQHNVRASLADLVALWYQTLLIYAGPNQAVYVDTENWRGSAGPRWAEGETEVYENYLRDFRAGLLESPVWVIPTDRDYDLDIKFEHVTNAPKVDNARLSFRDYRTVSAEFADFFADRLKVMLKDEGVRFDVIEAAFAAKDDDLVRTIARIRALEEVLSGKDGEALEAGFKRIANILNAETKKGAVPDHAPKVLPGAPEVEVTLVHKALSLAPTIDKQIDDERFAEALAALAALRPDIDAFLDGVLVNSEVPAERENRLALLNALRRLMDSVADLSKLA
ncbi:glycine--tRNA ligase subunit beta [Asticcacaulis sp. YBE204]|uniref:glycine--tRNA ligase subunit beta n=1 Tax=Asticcacaulis sp. YBE204 TaxID=1282363 RepID=UPI0003C3E12D|nr:glycine--tRNA ligase subunit beta [Asticcacaulis sp. YBE204]ESQ80444.1 glycyl-tRNA synthetase subunit beta [Asticcacaulis sp. YBE204]